MMIPIEQYIAMPGKYQKRLCECHQRKLSSACRRCLMVFCSQCHTGGRRLCRAAYGKTTHDVASIQDISTNLKAQMNELTELLLEKISRGDANVKGAWKGLSEEEDNVKDIAKEIEIHEAKLIQKVQDQCRRCKEEFEQDLEDHTTKTVVFTTELDVMRTLLQDLAVGGQLVSSTKHDVDILLLFNDLKSKIEEKLADKTTEKTIIQPTVFLSKGHPVVDADLKMTNSQVQSGETKSPSISYEDLKRNVIENGLAIKSPMESLETVVAFDGYFKATALLQSNLKEIQKKMALVPFNGGTSQTLLSAAETEYIAAFTSHGVKPQGTVYESFLSLLRGQCEVIADILLEMSKRMSQRKQFKNERDTFEAGLKQMGPELGRLTRKVDKA